MNSWMKKLTSAVSMTDSAGTGQPPHFEAARRGRPLTSKGTAIRRGVPLHDDRATLGSEELVCSGFPTTELAHMAEWFPVTSERIEAAARHPFPSDDSWLPAWHFETGLTL